MDHRAANPLAYEVSRAFIPPCTRQDVSLPVAALGPVTRRRAGTLAANSAEKEASLVPIVRPQKCGVSNNTEQRIAHNKQ